MDTKSKKSKLYSKKYKTIAVALFFFCVLSVYLTVIIFGNINSNWRFGVINAETYFDTETFRGRFNKLMDDVVDVHILYQDEEHIESGELITREEMISSFKNYYGIMDGVITQSTKINNTYDGFEVLGEIPDSLKANFIEYKDLVENRLPQYRKMYIRNQLEDYRSRRQELEKNKNFLYYLQDKDGVKVAGNITKSGITNLDRTIVVEGRFSNDNLGYYDEYRNEVLEESGYKFYAAIRDPLQAEDAFFQDQEDFNIIKGSFPILGGVATISICLFLLILCYLIRVTGQEEKGGKVYLIGIDRMYNDIHFLLVFAFGLFCTLFGMILFNAMLYRTMDFWTYILSTLMGGLIIISSGVGLSFLLSITRQVKGHQFFKNTMIAAIARKFREIFIGQTFRGWLAFLLIGYGFINCILTLLWMHISFIYGYGYGVLICVGILIIFNIFSAHVCIKGLGSLTKIMVAAKETAKGNLSYKLDITSISPSFDNFATDVSNIQNGLKKAVEEAVKGERMKSELITNVSHDLKTPLTSIITYADLLTKEELINETARGYVEILYDKSYRLKQLIEDLIEASKASSGNLSVVKGRVELRQLVMQAIGEMEEKIERAGLSFIISCEEEAVVFADGRLMWRIVENLLSNTIKYSMPNSRVYINIIKTDIMGILIVKNISEVAIDISADRLMERFVRGDKSRTTEGSGLGISITKSLSEIQGGGFEISIDGDLFKAIVNIPLWDETKVDFEQEEPQEKE